MTNISAKPKGGAVASYCLGAFVVFVRYGKYKVFLLMYLLEILNKRCNIEGLTLKPGTI